MRTNKIKLNRAIVIISLWNDWIYSRKNVNAKTNNIRNEFDVDCVLGNGSACDDGSLRLMTQNNCHFFSANEEVAMKYNWTLWLTLQIVFFPLYLHSIFTQLINLSLTMDDENDHRTCIDWRCCWWKIEPTLFVYSLIDNLWLYCICVLGLDARTHDTRVPHLIWNKFTACGSFMLKCTLNLSIRLVIFRWIIGRSRRYTYARNCNEILRMLW